MKWASAAVAATLVATCSALAADKHADQTGSVRDGKEVALEICAYCHTVAPDQPIKPDLNQPTHSFAEVANAPGTDAKSLRRFLDTTHWDGLTSPMTMPNPILLDEDRDDVINYILSLRTASAPRDAGHRLSGGAAKVEAGEYIALQLCSYCHVVTPDVRYRPDAGPPEPTFDAIANDPKTTAASLRKFITTAHWDEKTFPVTMPEQLLSAEETDEVVRYILSRRQHR